MRERGGASMCGDTDRMSKGNGGNPDQRGRECSLEGPIQRAESSNYIGETEHLHILAT